MILAVESSCDETAAAVVRNGREVLSNVISSQIALHTIYGGVVPEIASRKHIEKINQVIEQALAESGRALGEMDAIAVTYGPGLVGALLVGVSAAKAVSFASGIPLVGVHHIEGHISANYIENPELEPPYVCLVVSGGHSHLVVVRDYGVYEIIGRTRDDAAGEAFDKIARVLGLPYPGGPHIEALAREGNPVIPMPRMLKGTGGYNFSYSGLKTYIINYVHTAEQRGEAFSRADVACSFQHAALDILIQKTVEAASEKKTDTVTAGGGVIANGYLREKLAEACRRAGLKLVIPVKRRCTDNAAMIAAEGLIQYRAGNFSPFTINAVPSIPLHMN